MPKSKLELLLALVVIRIEEMRGGLLRPPTTGAATIGPLGMVKEEAEPSGREVEPLRGALTLEEEDEFRRTLELNLVDAAGKGSCSSVIAELLALFFAIH